MRSVVVLPQPLGPNRVKNSPSRISRLTRFTAATAPKRLTRFCMRSKPMKVTLLRANAHFEPERARDERDAERQRHDEYDRSEERRVGKECRSRWSTDDEKKKDEEGPREVNMNRKT